MSSPNQLGYNSNGEIYVQLPQGAQSDSNKLYLYVNIIDNSGGIRVFYLDTALVVTQNKNSATSIPNEVLNAGSSTDLSSLFQYASNVIIYGGDTKTTTDKVILIATILDGNNTSQVKILIFV